MIFITVNYGLKFDKNQSYSWIISGLISVIIEIVVQEPLLILLNAIIRSVLCYFYK